MTLAQQFALKWAARQPPHLHLSASNLARRYVDEKVIIKRSFNELLFEYTFSDGSIARTHGKGRSFKIVEPANVHS